jgi:uncharacterized membrane protein
MRSQKRSDVVFNMVLIAVFAALCYVVTWLVAIPLPASQGTGYINLSDLFIFALAALVNPWVGGIVGGISGMLADITLGGMFFAPFTLLIKFIEGVVSGFLFRKLTKHSADSKKSLMLKALVSFVCGGLLMAGLYMIPDYVNYLAAYSLPQGQSWYFIFFDLGFNVLQGVVNAVLGTLCYLGLKNVKNLTERHFGAETAFKDNAPSAEKDVDSASEAEKKQ